MYSPFCFSLVADLFYIGAVTVIIFCSNELFLFSAICCVSEGVRRQGGEKVHFSHLTLLLSVMDHCNDRGIEWVV